MLRNLCFLSRYSRDGIGRVSDSAECTLRAPGAGGPPGRPQSACRACRFILYPSLWSRHVAVATAGFPRDEVVRAEAPTPREEPARADVQAGARADGRAARTPDYALDS